MAALPGWLRIGKVHLDGTRATFEVIVHPTAITYPGHDLPGRPS